MPITGTVPVTAPIAPTLETATYAVTDPIYGKGSLRTVANTTQRDAITQARREKGMLVYVVNDGANGRYYSLIGGTGNEHWTEFNSGSGLTNYVESINGLTGVVNGVVRFSYGEAAPTVGITAGHKWFDSSRGTEYTYIYDGNTYQWVDLAGGGGNAGAGVGATGPAGATGPQLLIIDSFSTNLPRAFLKGSGYTVIGSDKSISVTYEGGLVPATGAVYLTDPTKGTGFPVYFSNSGMTGINFTSQTLTGNIGEGITFRLVVTGADGSGDKYDYTVFMGNEFRWGATTGSSLTAGDLSTTLTNSAVVTGPNIDFTLSTLITQYAYYAYPKSMGQTRQSINNASYGGMVLQGYGWAMDHGGLSAVSHTNSLGYSEDFYVYRSDHLHIGRNSRVSVYNEPA